MTLNDQGPPTSRAVTADEVWKLIESKLSERLLFLKITIGVIAAIISFFVSIIVWFLSNDETRLVLVHKYLFDIAHELDRPEGTKALDKYMQPTLAYTYSARLTLGVTGSQKREDAIPFYKTDNDRGRLMCTATYPNNTTKNVITATWNDLGSTTPFTFESPAGSIAHLNALIPITNDALFGRGIAATLNQKIRFIIDDSLPFTGDVTVDCSMQIVGRAKFPESLE